MCSVWAMKQEEGSQSSSGQQEKGAQEIDFEPNKKNWSSFWHLLVMQTQNAFNDKAVQFLLVCAAAYLTTIGGYESILTQHMAHVLAGLIVTPFILFSPLAGWISDRFPKSRIIKFSSLFQLFVFVLLLGAVFMESLELCVGCFFLLAIQSAILSPSKLGVIKELVGKRKLGYASGMLEMCTILGILGGTIIMSRWYAHLQESGLNPWEALRLPVYVLIGLTPVAIYGAFRVEKTQAKGKRPFQLSILVEHFGQLGSLLKQRDLRLSALAISYFWAFAGFIQLLSVQIATDTSQGTEIGIGADLANMMLMAGVGIAFGSVIGSILSKRRIELGLVPVGGLLMAFSCVMMALTTPLGFWFMTWMFFAGAGSALFLVPVNAYIQDGCEESKRGDVLAANNLINCFAGIFAVVLQMVFKDVFHFSVAIQFLILALFSIAATAYAAKLLPQDAVRFVILMAVRVVYRIRIENEYKMPKEGGVLLVPNHISYIDAFVISAASTRPVRFLIFDEYYKRTGIASFLKLFNAVPISRTRSKEAIQVAAEALVAGDVVCIFPEGQLSRTGTMNEVKRGFEMIARKANVPVQPVFMDGLWGSIFSFERNKFIYKSPYTVQYGLTVNFGQPMEPREATNVVVREELMKLSHESMKQRSILDKLEQFKKKSVKCLMGDSDYLEEVKKKFLALNEDQQKEILFNAVQLLDGPAFTKGQTIVVDTSIVNETDMLFLHVLPLLAKSPIILIDEKISKEKVDLIEDKYHPEAWLVNPTLDELLQKVDGVKYHFTNSEVDGLYSFWIEGGRVIAVNMPDPDAMTKTSQSQSGSKPNALGRLLAGYTTQGREILVGETVVAQIPLEYEIDSIGFILKAEKTEEG